MRERIYNFITKPIIIMISLMLILLPAIRLFGGDGIFAWHVRQREFYLSGIQCLIFVFVEFILSVMKKEKTILIIFGFSFLFMLMQGIIIPFMTVYIYCEMICFIGFFINQKKNDKYGIISNFLVGLSVWGSVAIICSVLKFGTINNLRIMTLFLVFVLAVLNKGKYELMIVKLSKYIQKSKECNLNLLLIIMMIILCLILAAKTNVGQDFDSIWYMLKPEYTLVGKRSFYEYLGYSAFVYYYPKLVEMFFLPISGLGDYSFILIGNVFVYIMLLVLGHKLMSLLCSECKEWLKLAFLLVVFSIPALTGVTPSVKGDVFGGFLVLAAIYYFVLFLKTQRIFELLFAICMLFLSTGTKLTFLLWGGIVGVIISIYGLMWAWRNRNKILMKRPPMCSVVPLCSSVFFILGIHYRTYKLTGYPLYPLFINLWNKLGFSANYAMKNASDAVRRIPSEKIGQRIYEFFMDPTRLDHTVMCWPTNSVIIFLVFAIGALLWRRKTAFDNILKILALISFCEMGVAFYYLSILQQPDGNYFYFPFLITYITCFYIIYTQSNMLEIKYKRRIMGGIFGGIVSLNLALTFVTNWSWGLGIRPFSREIVADNFSDYKLDDQEFKEKGYYNIAKYIEENFSDRRVIVSGDEGRMKGAVENCWSAFTDLWALPEIYDSYEHFKEYVKYAKIEGFVLLDNDESFFKEYVQRLISDVNCIETIEDDNAIFYIVSYGG